MSDNFCWNALIIVEIEFALWLNTKQTVWRFVFFPRRRDRQLCTSIDMALDNSAFGVILRGVSTRARPGSVRLARRLFIILSLLLIVHLQFDFLLLSRRKCCHELSACLLITDSLQYNKIPLRKGYKICRGTRLAFIYNNIINGLRANFWYYFHNRFSFNRIINWPLFLGNKPPTNTMCRSRSAATIGWPNRRRPKTVPTFPWPDYPVESALIKL